MKDIAKLSLDVSKVINKITRNIEKSHVETCEKIYNNVLLDVPIGYEEYKSTIKKNTEKSKIKISTFIGSNEKTEDGYFLGRIIENGTGTYALEEHIGHTKTFIESGYTKWYIPATKAKYKMSNELINIKGTLFYVGKPEPPHPHYRTALQKNREFYKQSVINAIREELK